MDTPGNHKSIILSKYFITCFVQSLEAVFYKLAYKSSQGEGAYLDDTKVATDVRMVFKDLI